MEKLVALRAPTVIFVTAVIANVDSIAVSVDSERNFIGEKIFVALIAKQVFIVEAAGADVRAVVNNGHLPFVKVLFAVLAKAIVLVQAVVADLNALAVTIDNLPRLGAKVLALLAEFFFIKVAVVADKSVGKFTGAGNAKPVSPYPENLAVMSAVLTDRNFGVEFRMRPIDITAKAVDARDLNSVFVAAVFFGLPEIGNAFKLGEFALNQISIKF